VRLFDGLGFDPPGVFYLFRPGFSFAFFNQFYVDFLGNKNLGKDPAEEIEFPNFGQADEDG
jgi:hypothetical protein